MTLARESSRWAMVSRLTVTDSPCTDDGTAAAAAAGTIADLHFASGGNSEIRMQAKSIDGGTAWTRKPFHAFRIDLISAPSRTSIGAGDDLATHRRGIEVRQPGFIA